MNRVFWQSHPFGISVSIIIVLILTIYFGCSEEQPVVPPPPEPPKAVSLSLVDVSCTEAFIKVTAADSVLPLSISLTKDASTIANFTLAKTDTVIVDTTLQPNQTYTYQTIEEINGNEEKSDTLQVKSLKITSNNFNWTTYTFGDPDGGSSSLRDIVIINDNNIWAVGEIYNDTTGVPYNAVHWDGSSWELKKINYNGIPPIIHSIAVISKNDIWFDPWFHWDGQDIQQLPIDPILMGVVVNKMWGSSEGLYVVGNNGFVAFRNNDGMWDKIESGTTTDINDIWGYYNPISNQKSVLCVASNILHQGEYRLLAISGGNAHDTLNWTYNDWLKGVWFKNQYSPIYICGSGVKKYKNNIWSELNLPNYFTEAISGSDYNNIFVVGDFGIAAHYNGVSWQTLNELSGIGKFLGVSIKEDIVVLCGYNTSGGIVGSALIVVGNN